MPLIARDYQNEVIVGARAALRESNRVMVQAPTGAGKTVIACIMAHGAQERGKRVMFTVHRDELLRQTARTMRAADIDFGFVAAGYTPAPKSPVQIASIDTLRGRLDRVAVPDILMVDEAHHAVSSSWARVIDHYVERGSRLIGLSATPCRLSGEPLSPMFERMVLGPRPAHLIEIGSLSRYRYIAPPPQVDMSGVHSRAGDYARGEAGAAMDKPRITGDAIDHYRKYLNGKRAIVFAVTVEHSEHIAAQFRAAGIPAEHIDGETPLGERVARLARFERGETLVLSNVGLFTEGFDVPALDGVIMLRPTMSLSLFLQMVGRALRPHDSKEHAIILDHVDNWKRHGMPDDDREWTLEGRKKKRRGPRDDDDALNVSQCPKCYTVHPKAPSCPACGHAYEVKSRDIEQVDGDLVEITPEMVAQMKWQKRLEVMRADNLETLQRIGEERGYSKGWARNVWNAKLKKRGNRPPPIGELWQA